jgi:PAS domain S-box-containing protein
MASSSASAASAANSTAVVSRSGTAPREEACQSLDRLPDDAVLRDHERRLRQLAEVLPDVHYYFRLMPSQAWEYVSPAIASLTGYTPEDCRTDPDLYWRMVYPADQDKSTRLLQVTPEAPVVQATMRWVIKDGGVIWIDHRAIGIFDACGRQVALEGVVRDISEQERAAQALHESENSYRQAVESSPNPIFAIDGSGAIITWNRACTQVFGYGPEMVGQNWAQLLGAAEQQVALHAMVGQVFQNRALNNVEIAYRCHDGMLCYTVSRLYPLLDGQGKVQACVLANTDITERKRSELHVAEIYRCFLHFGPDPLANIDRLTALCGELLGGSCALYNRLDDGLMCAWGLWQGPPDYKRVDQPEGHICYDVIRGDRDEIRVIRNLSASAYASSDPNVLLYGLQTYVGTLVRLGNTSVGSLCVVYQRDFTPDEADRRLMGIIASAIAVEENRKQAEEAASRRTHEMVELAQRESSLREANARLKELDQLKSQFVSNVSHELRTPLTNIKLYVSLLENGKPDKRPHYLQTLRRETELLQHLIEDLLDLSRLDMDKVHPTLRSVDLSELVRSLVHDRAALAASRGLQLVAITEPDLSLVPADPKMVAQVLTNLTTNAVSYTPAGGTVQVCTGSELRDGQAGVTIAVRDSGPGIDDDERSHIFERFFRGAAARESGVPGTGLGLAICREIVSRHNGDITLNTELGMGSEFIVWLPCETEDNASGQT